MKAFFLGVCVAAVFGFVGQWGVRQQFELEAFDHYAAIFYWHEDTKKLEFKWLDDYFADELVKSLDSVHATPIPDEEMNRL